MGQLKSPAFSSFRHLMDLYDQVLEEERNNYLALEAEKNSIIDHLDKNQCILFFRRNDDIFGAPEESRLIFAKMKSNDKDMPPTWKDEAKFIAVNLLQSLMGQHIENLFGFKDLSNIKLLDRDVAIEELMKKEKKKKK